MLYEQNKDMCYKRYNGDQLHYHLGMGNETLTEARRYMSELISELNKCK